MFIQENLNWAKNFFYRHETQNLNDKKVSYHGLTSIFFLVAWNSGFWPLNCSLYIYWNIIAFCVSFCCTTKWICYMYTHTHTHIHTHTHTHTSLEKEMATHSSILAWKIPWTEEPGGLLSMGLQRVGYDWVSEHIHVHISSPSWTSLPASPHPTHLSHHSALSWALCAIGSRWLSILHTVEYIYMSNPNFQVIPRHPPQIHRSMLHICNSFPAMELGSSVLMVRTSVYILSLFSLVWLFATWWTAACQAPLSMGFSRQDSMAIIIKIYKW